MGGVVALLAGLAGTCLLTQSGLAETLDSALAAAYASNPRLDAERARLRATDEEVARAMSGYRPSISGTADIGYQETHTRPGASSDGSLNPKGYGLNVAQPVFRGLRTWNGVREAEATVRAQREVLRATEQSVLLETVTAYMDVVRDQAVVGSREASIKVLERETAATASRVRIGELTRTDLAQSEARLAAARSQLDLARANLVASKAAFERVVGHPPVALTLQRSPDRLLPGSRREAEAAGQAESPEVLAAVYREEAARHTIDKTRGELLPSVEIQGSYTHRYDPNPRVDAQEVATVTGRMSVPIYSGGEVHARVRQAKHTQIGRLKDVQQARAAQRAAIVAAWSQLVAVRAKLISDRSLVAATELALVGVRSEQNVGQRTLLDVLNAEQEALNARVELATTQRNVVVAGYVLLSAIGRLSLEQVGGAGAIYDPEANFEATRRRWWGLTISYPDGRSETHDFWRDGRPGR